MKNVLLGIILAGLASAIPGCQPSPDRNVDFGKVRLPDGLVAVSPGYTIVYDNSCVGGTEVGTLIYSSSAPYNLVSCDPPECCPKDVLEKYFTLPSCLIGKPGSYDMKIVGGCIRYYKHGTTIVACTTGNCGGVIEKFLASNYTIYDHACASGGDVVHVTYSGTPPYGLLSACDPPICCGPKGWVSFPASLPECLKGKPKGSYDRMIVDGCTKFKYVAHSTTPPSSSTPVVCSDCP